MPITLHENLQEVLWLDSKKVSDVAVAHWSEICELELNIFCRIYMVGVNSGGVVYVTLCCRNSRCRRSSCGYSTSTIEVWRESSRYFKIVVRVIRGRIIVGVGVVIGIVAVVSVIRCTKKGRESTTTTTIMMMGTITGSLMMMRTMRGNFIGI